LKNSDILEKKLQLFQEWHYGGPSFKGIGQTPLHLACKMIIKHVHALLN